MSLRQAGPPRLAGLTLRVVSRRGWFTRKSRGGGGWGAVLAAWR